jgi:hypothetical protein
MGGSNIGFQLRLDSEVVGFNGSGFRVQGSSGVPSIDARDASADFAMPLSEAMREKTRDGLDR